VGCYWLSCLSNQFLLAPTEIKPVYCSIPSTVWALGKSCLSTCRHPYSLAQSSYIMSLVPLSESMYTACSTQLTTLSLTREYMEHGGRLPANCALTVTLTTGSDVLLSCPRVPKSYKSHPTPQPTGRRLHILALLSLTLLKICQLLRPQTRLEPIL
jgi:hypothetical protein